MDERPDVWSGLLSAERQRLEQLIKNLIESKSMVGYGLETGELIDILKYILSYGLLLLVLLVALGFSRSPDLRYLNLKPALRMSSQ